MKWLLILLLTASAVGAQDYWLLPERTPAPLSDSAILCQPYFDLAIPDDIKNSVLWMFCDSIKYVVSAGLDSKISTDIVYFTYYGAMTYYDSLVGPNIGRENGTWNLVYYTPYREYGLTDWHTPFAVLWERKVMRRIE